MMNNILISSEVEKTLESILPICQKDINVISGFCKVHTLEYLDSLIKKEGVKKRLLVRFLPSDLSSGATDKEIFSYCKSHGWSIFVDHSIHAKTYVFDRIKCIMGSANLTDRGLGISDNSNKEASVCFELDDDSYTKILSLYKDSVELDSTLYEFIVSHMNDEDVIKHKQYKMKKISIECLFPEDFPTELSDIIELYNSRAYKWLVNYLETKETKSAYYGELASAIHSVFVKDPRPYRKDIKQHLTDLLSAIKRLNISEIKIERPNYSELVSLK